MNQRALDPKNQVNIKRNLLKLRSKVQDYYNYSSEIIFEAYDKVLRLDKLKNVKEILCYLK